MLIQRFLISATLAIAGKKKKDEEIVEQLYVPAVPMVMPNYQDPGLTVDWSLMQDAQNWNQSPAPVHVESDGGGHKHGGKHMGMKHGSSDIDSARFLSRWMLLNHVANHYHPSPKFQEFEVIKQDPYAQQMGQYGVGHHEHGYPQYTMDDYEHGHAQHGMDPHHSHGYGPHQQQAQQYPGHYGVNPGQQPVNAQHSAYAHQPNTYQPASNPTLQRSHLSGSYRYPIHGRRLQHGGGVYWSHKDKKTAIEEEKAYKKCMKELHHGGGGGGKGNPCSTGGLFDIPSKLVKGLQVVDAPRWYMSPEMRSKSGIAPVPAPMHLRAQMYPYKQIIHNKY